MGFLYLVDCLISIFLFQKSFIDLNSITWLTVDYKKTFERNLLSKVK